MDLRLIPAALLLFASTTAAQGDVPVKKPTTPPDVAQASKQDPVTQERSSGDIITDLQREKERLQKEIEYARNRAKNANRMLAEKLGQRGQEFGSIDAGRNRPAQPAAAPIKKARLMSDEEREKHGDDVIMLVAGLPVQRAKFDAMMGYLKSLSNSGDDNMRSQRSLFELIRTASVAAAFPGNSVEGKVSEVYSQLQDGKSMEEVTTTFGTVLGAKEDGTVDVTRNSFLGVEFEQVAFSLKEGEYSKPFRNVFGFVIVGVEKIEKGATPELDKVKARAVQIPYEGDEEELSMAQSAASRGQVDIVVSDQKVLDMLPAMFRPMMTPQRPTDAGAGLRQTLKSLDAQIKTIEESEKVEQLQPQLEALKTQREKVKQMLQELPKAPVKTDADSAAPAVDIIKKKADGKIGADGAPVVPKKAPVKVAPVIKKTIPQKQQ